jgi:hypothetical protein
LEAEEFVELSFWDEDSASRSDCPHRKSPVLNEPKETLVVEVRDVSRFLDGVDGFGW